MEDTELNRRDEPFSQKALWFIAKSLRVHIEQLEERLKHLEVVDGDLESEDEAADLMNDAHYLKTLHEETLEKYRRLVS